VLLSVGVKFAFDRWCCQDKVRLGQVRKWSCVSRWILHVVQIWFGAVLASPGWPFTGSHSCHLSQSVSLRLGVTV
jgi:hypothetical protein